MAAGCGPDLQWGVAQAAAQRGGVVELTHDQRTRDPADQAAQALFRAGRVREAVESYATRERIHTGPELQPIEDLALEAAHRDRANGQTVLVVAQTSNEHLDELNARAQAIRAQHRELGQQAPEISNRPYSLHPGDEIRVRRTIRHPDAGQVRNGTTGRVSEIDPRSHTLWLELQDASRIRLDEQQIEQADLRLAYVQHPFPAQGQTTDTAHPIATEQTTREGAYVAITRAREQTHIYATDSAEAGPDPDRLENLAERLIPSEPEVPTIDTPLAHEQDIRTGVEQQLAPESEATREVGHSTRARTWPGTRSDALAPQAERGLVPDRSVGFEP